MRSIAIAVCLLCIRGAIAAEILIDLSGYQADCAVRVEAWNGHLRFSWPLERDEVGVATLDLNGEQPLIESLAVRRGSAEPANILQHVNPLWQMTIGQRRLVEEKPHDQQWQVFFDNPAQRPHEAFASSLALKSVK